MKRRDSLEHRGLSTLKIKLGVLEGEFAPHEIDRAAGWELYVELLTRATTQYLAPEDSDEGTALESVFAIFPLTREILRRHGSDRGEFAKLSTPVLNQIIRLFTAKWYCLSLDSAFQDRTRCNDFRGELSAQTLLRDYTRARADMAQVEDLTSLELPMARQSKTCIGPI